MALASEPAAAILSAALPDRARWSRRVRRTLRSTVVVLGGLFALLVVAMALFAGPLAPAPPDEQNFDLIESPPGRQALFGTDRFGRDVLSRVIHGARISLYVAAVSIGASMLVGGAFGLAAGYQGGVWDNAINRVMDVFFSIPGLLLSIGIAAMRGPGVNSDPVHHPLHRAAVHDREPAGGPALRVPRAANPLCCLMEVSR